MPLNRQVLFVQGAGEDVHDTWDNKLVMSLASALGAGFDVRYPRMPHEADPTYDTWAPAIARELDALGKGAIAVGHSVGGTMLINAVAEGSPHHGLSTIVLIAAPFLGAGGWAITDWAPPLTRRTTLSADVRVYLVHGLADATVPSSHAELYAAAIPHAQLRLLPDRDHQLNNDLSDVAAVIRSSPVVD